MFWKLTNGMLSGHKSHWICTALGLAILMCGVVVAQQSGEANSPRQDKTDNRCIVIVGAAHSPFRLDLTRPIRLSEAIQLAGGTTANPDAVVHVVKLNLICDPNPTIHVSRLCVDCHRTTGVLEPVRIYKLSSLIGEDDKTNPYLQAGDLVAIRPHPVIYVTGHVVAPQLLPYAPGMTLTTAITNVGGLVRDSDSRKIRVIRSKPNSSAHTEIVVDLKKVKKHPEWDLALEPNDIIEVPFKGRRGHGPIGLDRKFDSPYPVYCRAGDNLVLETVERNSRLQ